MSTFKTFEHKRLLTSTPATPTSSLLRPSRPFAPLSTPASQQVPPVTQAQLDHVPQFGHSFARIPLFPSVSQDTHRQKVDQPAGIDPGSQLPPIPAPTPSAQLSPETTSSDKHANYDYIPHLRHSFVNIPLFPVMQRKAVLLSPLHEEDQLGTRIQAAKSGGHPLDERTQRVLEHGLRTSLPRVRLHTDAEADHLSRSVNAVAFTAGSDIFFRSGVYNPGSSQGLHLLAHEATHVVQQATGPVAGTPIASQLSISDPSDRFEQAAERSATQITAGTLLQREAVNELTIPHHSPLAYPFFTGQPLFFKEPAQTESAKVVNRTNSTSPLVVQRTVWEWAKGADGTLKWIQVPDTGGTTFDPQPTVTGDRKSGQIYDDKTGTLYDNKMKWHREKAKKAKQAGLKEEPSGSHVLMGHWGISDTLPFGTDGLGTCVGILAPLNDGKRYFCAHIFSVFAPGQDYQPATPKYKVLYRAYVHFMKEKLIKVLPQDIDASNFTCATTSYDDSTKGILEALSIIYPAMKKVQSGTCLLVDESEKIEVSNRRLNSKKEVQGGSIAFTDEDFEKIKKQVSELSTSSSTSTSTTGGTGAGGTQTKS